MTEEVVKEALGQALEDKRLKRDSLSSAWITYEGSPIQEEVSRQLAVVQEEIRKLEAAL